MEKLVNDPDAFLFSLTHWSDIRPKEPEDNTVSFSPHHFIKFGYNGLKWFDFKLPNYCN